jgi:hypothetical protein
MKPILVFPAPQALGIPKSVFLEARLRRAFKKTDFYNENCWQHSQQKSGSK